ncbi:hypothetical protein GIB67_029320 [Kingdonia uniflora]|uniref:Coenzyme Q-binding protein COQ10 START domain-containing protein n=1 Tax=Kingdonia uniflora TaxID=39325 RepID=A0A7J7N8B2_9MAGN|nr:hypothetical protein GIB67_029320 [Kingdonia uniflora]
MVGNSGVALSEKGREYVFCLSGSGVSLPCHLPPFSHIGQQNLAFGLKFNAKGIVECYEKDLEQLPYGRKRDIKFDMVEGDFQTFQGKWSIEQVEKTDTESSVEQIFQTTLSYIVDVKPKLWLPVRLVEGRLSSEIKSNLIAIRNEIQNTVINTTVDES